MSALAAQHNAINLSQGFPDFDPDPVLSELLCRALKNGHNQYAPMPGIPGLRAYLAELYGQKYGTNIDPEAEVTITAGATQAIFSIITALVKPGDEVIIIEPAYDCYKPAIRLCGGLCKSFPLIEPDYRIDWNAFKMMISANTRLIIINTPHNPTGKLLAESDMAALSNLLRDREIFVLSDEVYEHITFDGRKHVSVLNYPDLYARAYVVFSFGKTFHNTGWKTGYCIAPPYLTRELRKVHQFNVFSVHTPTQYALQEYIAQHAQMDEIGSMYQEKRDLLTGLLSDTPLQAIPSDGTYFQLYSYRGLSDMEDVEFARHLTIEAGVATIPVSVFYAQKTGEQILRFCFAKKEETLSEAAHRLKTYFARHQ